MQNQYQNVTKPDAKSPGMAPVYGTIGGGDPQPTGWSALQRRRRPAPSSLRCRPGQFSWPLRARPARHDHYGCLATGRAHGVTTRWARPVDSWPWWRSTKIP